MKSKSIGLQSLSLAPTYRSDRHNIGQDFLVPCLAQATTYDRAVGYFTSSALAEASRGLGPFIERGGIMRLIASPYLLPEDAEAMRKGYESREHIVTRALERVLSATMPDPQKASVTCLAWLIAEGRLDIKIALLEREGNVGLYHEKIGILRDDRGDAVVFTGSANESAGGLLINFESVEVYRSWISGDTDRVDAKIADFENLWSDQTTSLTIMPFPAALRDALIRQRPRHRPQFDSEGNAILSLPDSPSPDGAFMPHVPAGLDIRPYQDDAISAWFKANLRGTLRMATGTGKTVTALALIAKLAAALKERDRPFFVLVLCPYQNLVEQWAENVEQFGVDPTRCYRGQSYWKDQLSAQITAVLAGRPFGIAIATYDTFQTDGFQAQLRAIEKHLLIVADEMHNAGAPGTRNALPPNAPFRLGLSATPERWHDDEGTEALFAYFGPPVFELGLAEAIKIGALTPYQYFPVIVELDIEEMAAYTKLTEQIRKISAGQENTNQSELDGPLKAMLIKRARILANASGKIPALKQVMDERTETTHNLIYCGDGRMPADAETDNEEELRQISGITRMIGNELKMKVAQYTSETAIDRRRTILEEFGRGRLQAVVAIRCLDEGVDIPETRRAFILASSTNPRQFIQRRGRILRRAPGKIRAELYDFIAIPPFGGLNEADFRTERGLVRRELERIVEFAGIAENGPQAMQKLLDLRKRYGLLDLGT